MPKPAKPVDEKIEPESLSQSTSQSDTDDESDESELDESQDSRERNRDPNLRSFLAYKQLMSEVEPRFEKSKGIMRKHQEFGSRNLDEIDLTELVNVYGRTKIFINNFEDYVTDAMTKISNLPPRQFPTSEDKCVGTETDTRCRNAQYEPNAKSEKSRPNVSPDQMTQMKDIRSKSCAKLEKVEGNSPDQDTNSISSWEELEEKERNLNKIVNEATVKVIRIKQILKIGKSQGQSNPSVFFVNQEKNEDLHKVQEEIRKIMERIQKESCRISGDEAKSGNGQQSHSREVVNNLLSYSGNENGIKLKGKDATEYHNISKQLIKLLVLIEQEIKEIKIAEKMLKDLSISGDENGTKVEDKSEIEHQSNSERETMDKVVQKPSYASDNLSYSNFGIENVSISFSNVKLEIGFQILDQLDEELDQIMKMKFRTDPEKPNELNDKTEFEDNNEIDHQSSVYEIFVSQDQDEQQSSSTEDEEEDKVLGNERFEMGSNFEPENLYETLSREIPEFVVLMKNDKFDENNSSPAIPTPNVKIAPRFPISFDANQNHKIGENYSFQDLVDLQDSEKILKKSKNVIIPSQSASIGQEFSQKKSHQKDNNGLKISDDVSSIINWVEKCDSDVDDNISTYVNVDKDPVPKQEDSTFERIFGISPPLGYNEIYGEVEGKPSSKIKEKVSPKMIAKAAELFRQESKNQGSAAGLSTCNLGMKNKTKRDLFPVQKYIPSWGDKMKKNVPKSAEKILNLDNQSENRQGQKQSISRILNKIHHDFDQTRTNYTPRNTQSYASNQSNSSSSKPTSNSRMPNPKSRSSTLTKNSTSITPKIGKKSGQKSSFSSNSRPTTITTSKISTSRPTNVSTRNAANFSQNSGL